MNLSKSFLLIGTCFLLSFTLPSYADDATRDSEIVARFKKCDVNNDGKLTREEAKGCMPRIYDHFSYIDSDNKGYLTVAQIEAVANR